jgi:hypothetical protein
MKGPWPERSRKTDHLLETRAKKKSGIQNDIFLPKEQQDKSFFLCSLQPKAML